jgi:hypothetical protein
MIVSPITLIIIALFVFWRGFARGAFYRSREMLVAHGFPVEPTWLEWIGEKAFNGIAWIARTLRNNHRHHYIRLHPIRCRRHHIRSDLQVTNGSRCDGVLFAFHSCGGAFDEAASRRYISELSFLIPLQAAHQRCSGRRQAAMKTIAGNMPCVPSSAH